MRHRAGRAWGLVIVFVAVAVSSAAGQDLRLRPVWRFGDPGAGQVELADLDGDGTPGILSCGPEDPAYISSDDGDGGFPVSWIGDTGNCSALATADRDRDGRLEVYVVTRARSSWDPPATLVIMIPDQLQAVARLPLDGEVSDLAVADVDADDGLEIVVVDNEQTLVLDALTLQLEWRAEGKGGEQVGIGDLDGDGSPEILVNSASIAHVLDGEAHQVEYSWSGGFGSAVAVADVLGDGRAEIVFMLHPAFGGGHGLGVTAAGSDEPIWFVEDSYGLFDLSLADLDGDGFLDVVTVGTSDHVILGFDGASGQELWRFDPPARVYSVTAGDVDGDGQVEVVWSGPGVGDPISGAVEWTEPIPLEPLLQVSPGDVDGDGRLELAVLSEDQYSYGLPVGLVTIDDRRMRWLQDVRGAPGAVAIGQVDDDPEGEVVVLSEYVDRTVIDVLDGASGAVEWLSEQVGEAGLPALAVAELDADGRDEIVGGIDDIVYVFDGASRVIQWTSENLGDVIWDLSVGNADDDPALEIGLVTKENAVLLDTADGSVQARAEADDAHVVLVAPGQLVIGDPEHSVDLHAFSPTGELLWARRGNCGPAMELTNLRRDGGHLVAYAESCSRGSESFITVLSGDGLHVRCACARPKTWFTDLFAVDLDGDDDDELGIVFGSTIEIDVLEPSTGAEVTLSSIGGEPGSSMLVEMVLQSGGEPISSLIVNIALQSGLSYVGVTQGEAAAAATVVGSPAPDGALISVVAAPGQTLGDGVVAVVELAVAADAAPGVYLVEAKPVSVIGGDGSALQIDMGRSPVVVSEVGGLPTECGIPRWFVAASAHVAGEGGSLWRTDLSVYNPLPAPQELELWFFPRGADNSGATCVRAGEVPGRTAAYFEDVVLELLGTDGAGAIGVGVSGGDWAEVVVSSRTYNLADTGTFGQSIPGLTVEDGIQQYRGATLTQLHENTGHRTNLGLLEVSGRGSTVQVRLFAADGSLLGESTYALRAHEAMQVNRVFGGGSEVENGFATVQVVSGGTVLVYASVVDNLTGDPTYVVPGRR